MFACGEMLVRISLVVAYFTCGAALQQLGPKHNSSVPSRCYAGEKLYFVHIMKDGGTSVDQFFDCVAEQNRFAVQHAEGPGVQAVSGVTSCPTAFCRAHHALVDKAEACGDEFETARSFTVLREPVSRAFSLFNYYKYRKDDSRLSHLDTFGDLLRKIDDTNKGIQESSSLGEWTNNMTTFWFNPNPMMSMMTANHEYPGTKDDLEDAKKLLRQVDAIFFTEQLDNWMIDFQRSGLPFSQFDFSALIANPLCSINHVNQADCTECADAPTDEEVKLATELLSLDIELYEFAKTLPQSFL